MTFIDDYEVLQRIEQLFILLVRMWGTMENVFLEPWHSVDEKTCLICSNSLTRTQ